MTPGLLHRIVAAAAGALMALLPVAALCCVLTCGVSSTDAASGPHASHCDEVPEAAGTTTVSSADTCLVDAAVVLADATRPAPQAPNGARVSERVAIVPDAARVTVAIAPGLRRLPPRASPLLSILRI